MIQPVSERVLGAQHCSYKVGGTLDEPYMPNTLDEAIEVLSLVQKRHAPLTVLGGGANTIIASKGIRGITFLCKRLMFVEPVNETTFRIGAGMPLARVSTLAQENALTGAEFMIGVPGTLGGAVTMNAGAMGQETAAILDYALVYHLETGKVEHWTQEDLKFSYRKSAIKPPERVVLGAQLSFQSASPKAINGLMQKSLDFRKSSHPKEPSGGSVFQNPAPDKPAGRLLDELGAKGWQEGGAMVSLKHANFIVNTGNATSTDILKLMLRMKQAMESAYGVSAHPENRFVGEATEEESGLWKELTGYAA